MKPEPSYYALAYQRWELSLRALLETIDGPLPAGFQMKRRE